MKHSLQKGQLFVVFIFIVIAPILYLLHSDYAEITLLEKGLCLSVSSPKNISTTCSYIQ
jgi:hypothetical protein